MPLKSSHGFTLLEALISLGLTVVISSAVVTYFHNVSKMYNVLDSTQVKCVAELERQVDILVPDKSMTYAPLAIGSNGELKLYSTRDDKQALKEGRIKPSLVKEIYAIEMEKTKSIPMGLYRGPLGKDKPTSPIFRDDGLPVLQNHLLLKGALAQLTNIYHEFLGSSEDVCSTGVPTDKIITSYGFVDNYKPDVNPDLLKDFKSQTKVYPIFGRSQDDKRTEIYCPRPFVPTATQTIPGGGRIFKIPTNAVPDGGFMVELTGTYKDMSTTEKTEKTCSITRKFYQGTDNALTQPEAYARVTNVFPEGMNYKSKNPPDIFKQDFPYGFPKFVEYLQDGEKKYSVDSALTVNSCQVAGSNAVLSRWTKTNPLKVMQKFEVTMEVGTAPGAHSEPGTVMLCKDRSRQLAPGWLNRQNGWTKLGEQNPSWAFDFEQLQDQTKWVPCDRVTLCGVPVKTVKFIPDVKNPYNLKYELKFESSDSATPGVRDAFYGCDLKMDVALADPAGNSSSFAKKLKTRTAGETGLSKLISRNVLEVFFQPHNAFTCKLYKRSPSQIIKAYLRLQIAIFRVIVNVVCTIFSAGGCAEAQAILKIVQLTQTIYSTYQMIEALTQHPPSDVPVGDAPPVSAPVGPEIVLHPDTFVRVGQAIKDLDANNKVRMPLVIKNEKRGYSNIPAGALKPVTVLDAPLSDDEIRHSFLYTMEVNGLKYQPGTPEYENLWKAVKNVASEKKEVMGYSLLINQVIDLHEGNYNKSVSVGEDVTSLGVNKPGGSYRSIAEAHTEGNARLKSIIISTADSSSKLNSELEFFELEKAEREIAAADSKYRNMLVTSSLSVVEAEINKDKKLSPKMKADYLEFAKAKAAAIDANHAVCDRLNVGNPQGGQACNLAMINWQDSLQNEAKELYAHPEKMLMNLEVWRHMSEDERQKIVSDHAAKRVAKPRSKDICTNTGDGVPCAGQPPVAIPQDKVTKLANSVAVIASSINQVKQAKQIAEAVKAGNDRAAGYGALNLATTQGGLLTILGVGNKGGTVGQGLFGENTDGVTAISKYNPISILVNGFDGKGNDGIVGKMSDLAIGKIVDKFPVSAIKSFLEKQNEGGNIAKGFAQVVANVIIQALITGEDLGTMIKELIPQMLRAFVVDFFQIDVIAKLKGQLHGWRLVDTWESCADESQYRRRKKWNPFDDEKTQCSKRTDIQLPEWIKNKDYPSCLVSQFNFNYPNLANTDNKILTTGRQKLENGTILTGKNIRYQNQQTFMTRESLIDGKSHSKGIDFSNGLMFDATVNCVGGKNPNNTYFANWQFPKTLNENDPTTYDEIETPVAAVCETYGSLFTTARGRGRRDPRNWTSNRTCPTGSVPASQIYGAQAADGSGPAESADQEALNFYQGDGRQETRNCIMLGKMKIVKEERQKTSVMLTKVAYQFDRGANGKISGYKEIVDQDKACVAAFDIEDTEFLPTVNFVKDEYEFCNLSGQNSNSLCKLVVFAKYKAAVGGYGNAISLASNMINNGHRAENDSKFQNWNGSLKFVNWQASVPMKIATFRQMSAYIATKKSQLVSIEATINTVASKVILEDDPKKKELEEEKARQLSILYTQKYLVHIETENKLRAKEQDGGYGLDIPSSATEGGESPNAAGEYYKNYAHYGKTEDQMHKLYEIDDLWFVLKRPEDIKPKGRGLYKTVANSDSNVIHMFEYRLPVQKSMRWCFHGTDIDAAKDLDAVRGRYINGLKKPACLSNRPF